jgi:hypothetical protein
VEELLPVGALDPNEIHIPGIMVQRIFKEKRLKRIEQRTVRQKVVFSLQELYGLHFYDLRMLLKLI